VALATGPTGGGGGGGGGRRGGGRRRCICGITLKCKKSTRRELLSRQSVRQKFHMNWLRLHDGATEEQIKRK